MANGSAVQFNEEGSSYLLFWISSNPDLLQHIIA
jgi:hypothetical protein